MNQPDDAGGAIRMSDDGVRSPESTTNDHLLTPGNSNGGWQDVVLACDDIFAMPAAATMASVIKHSDDPKRVRFTLIDCGISSSNLDRLRRSVEQPGATFRAPPFASEVPTVSARASIIPSVATFARLFIADHLSDADVAVYLDSDTIVTCDIAPLVRWPLEGSLVAGVVDEQGGGLTREIPRLAPFVTTEVGDSPYVNAGVLVLDLASWRAENLSAQFTDLLSRGSFRYADQDVLNVVCAGRIGVLPPEFNVQTHMHLNATPGQVPAEVEGAAVIHYTQRPKPWHKSGDAGLAADRWFEALDQTGWRGWRPTTRRLLVPKVRRAMRLARSRPLQIITGLSRKARKQP
jgi:lipopolysaccharide biosynthesis glycosyltransferase